MQRKLFDKLLFMLTINGISLNTYLKEMERGVNLVCETLCLKNKNDCPYPSRAIYYNKNTKKFKIITSAYSKTNDNDTKNPQKADTYYCAGFINTNKK